MRRSRVLRYLETLPAFPLALPDKYRKKALSSMFPSPKSPYHVEQQSHEAEFLYSTVTHRSFSGSGVPAAGGGRGPPSPAGGRESFPLPDSTETPREPGDVEPRKKHPQVTIGNPCRVSAGSETMLQLLKGVERTLQK